jgi:hypothetical protein
VVQTHKLIGEMLIISSSLKSLNIASKKNFSTSLALITSIPVNSFLFYIGPLKKYKIFSTTKSNSINSSTWPIAIGKIVKEGEIIEKNNVYLPSIEYNYSIGERNFTGDKLIFTFPKYLQNKEKLTEILENVQHKTPLFVKFNPKNPSESVLEPGNHFEKENLQLLLKHQLFWVFIFIFVNFLMFSFLQKEIQIFNSPNKEENEEEIKYKEYERKRMLSNIFLRKHDKAIAPPETKEKE